MINITYKITHILMVKSVLKKVLVTKIRAFFICKILFLSYFCLFCCLFPTVKTADIREN